MTSQQPWNAARPAPLHVDEDGGLAALMGTQNVTMAREAALRESAILQAARDVLQTAFADEARKQFVVAALLAQTPSRRHAALLGHMEVALAQTHDVLIKRVQAAYTALHAAEQRRSQASTELSQMRYSGFAIGLAGTGMAAYLALTQWQRFTLAYQGPIGLVAGVIVGSVLIAPFIRGFLLSRADDLDY